MELLKIKYDEEANFLRIEAFGKILIDDLARIFKKISKFSKLIPRLNVLLDLKASFFGHRPNELALLIHTFKEAIGRFKYVKIANIISRKFETAIGILFIIELNDDPYLNANIVNALGIDNQWLMSGLEVN